MDAAAGDAGASPDGGSPVDPTMVSDAPAFIDSYCARAGACCGEKGFPADEAVCRAKLAAQSAASFFDVTFARTCLTFVWRSGPAPIAGAQSACPPPPGESWPCARVFQPKGGALAPGDLCAEGGPDGSCSSAPGEPAICAPSSQTDVQNKTAHCHRLKSAGPGDPCGASLAPDGSPAGTALSGIMTDFYCDPALNLVCSGGTCVPHDTAWVCPTPASIAAGDVCATVDFGSPSELHCASVCKGEDAYCDPIPSRCATKLSDGAECSLPIQCRSGVCEGSKCQPGFAGASLPSLCAPRP